jgi:hypothetical protein
MASYITGQSSVLFLPLLRVVHSGRPNTEHSLAGYTIEGPATTRKKVINSEEKLNPATPSGIHAFLKHSLENMTQL